MNIVVKIVLICSLTIPLNVSATLYYDELPINSTTLFSGDVFAVPQYDNLTGGDPSEPPVFGLRPFASIDSITFSLITGNVNSPPGVLNEIEFDLFNFTHQFTADSGADLVFTITNTAILSLFLDGWQDFNIITNTADDGWTLFGIDVFFEGTLATVPEPSSGILLLLIISLLWLLRRCQHMRERQGKPENGKPGQIYF